MSDDGFNMLAAALAYARIGVPVFPIWSALSFEKGGFICGCGRLGCKSGPSIRLARLPRTD